MNTKQTIYFPSSTTAADMIARRNALRAVSNNYDWEFISKPRIVCKPIQERSVIEPAPIVHQRIHEVV